MLPVINLAVNRCGRLYVNGRRLPSLFRERVLDLNHVNLSQRQISERTRTSRLSNVLCDNDHTNSSIPTPRAVHPWIKVTPDVIEFIEMEKLLKPSVNLSELQEQMILDRVVMPGDVPSKAAISKCIKNDLCMSYKKVQVILLESTTAGNIALVDAYLEQVSDLNLATLHFFDECIVRKMTSNHMFENSYIGTPAFECQKYASNANFTVNLLHSMRGLDHVNILEGPSNGNGLLLLLMRPLSW